MPAECRNFRDPIEPILYLDATYAIATLDETEAYHSDCANFYERLESESVLSVVSDLVYNELAFHRIKAAMTIEGIRTNQHWLDVKRNRPNFIATIMPDVESKKAELNCMVLKLSIGDAVTERAFQLMRNYSLLPTDAYHIAIALDAGVNCFVTLDRDFWRVDGIIVYTCLP
ncbi:type II toxin-antitoxin system VapC family toxin [Candidatus Poribacteria bacterium]|nr:type II toxin-antitoxin system VapC family toxin [Candidatus Poribacteria bacterium]